MTTLEDHGRRDILEIYDSGITWADRKREQALARAREQGLEQGLAGLRRLVLRQMELRFGKVPAAVRRRVLALDAPEALVNLGEQVLTADSLGDLDL